MRARAGLSVVGLVAGTLAVIGGAAPASGGPPSGLVNVTTTADITDSGDGLVSLREAVGIANTDGVDSTVALASDAVYTLTICGGPTQEDSNADGDLDHTTTQDLVIDGAFATIEQTCPFDRVVDGVGGGDLRLEDVAITGGDVIGGNGGGVRMAAPGGDLYLAGAFIYGNRTTADGGGVATSSQISPNEIEVEVWRSSITGNSVLVGDGGGAAFYGGPVEIINSTIAHNRTDQGYIGGLRVGGWPVVMDHATIIANRTGGDGTSEGAAANLGASIVDSTATVVALGSGAPDCALPPPSGPGDDPWMTSNGANADTDGSCRFTEADDVDAPHPMLRLADDPRWTSSHAPSIFSPVIGAEEEPCSQAGDQLGQQRPDPDDFGGCDSGAVEQQPDPCVREFEDVDSTSTFFHEICWMVRSGITTGFPGQQFRPAQSVTRQSMAAFLYRFAFEPPFPEPETDPFPDVGASSTFGLEIAWMAGAGITGGFGDGTFRPGQAVTRQAMAAFLYRVAGEPEFEDPAEATFPDVPTTSTFFTEIEWMADAGVSVGFGDGTWRPAQAITRQAMAAFLLNMAQNVQLAGL
jgi:hypothetical protein